ncbi:MAG: helix-turn-helix domain-containing protein [Paracoccaceae bacterium]|nr:helix-turn-helix domain-containing protein [Paracoccaceae bacterium]
MGDTVTDRLAAELAAMRAAQGWTLDQLAERSGVSRAALSRLEHAEVSPSADVLARLCAAHGLPLSRLMAQVETGFDAVVPVSDQPQWRDPDRPVNRRVMSPAAQGLSGEVQECRFGPGTVLDLPAPAQPGQEHHMIMMQGQLRVTLNDETHEIENGDALRFHLIGPMRQEVLGDKGVRYFLFQTR